jgi:hypothetical protein
MRRQYKKYALWGASFGVLITLGAATAAFTAGAAPFGANQVSTTIVSTVTTGGSTVVTTITTTVSGSSSTDTTGTTTTGTDTTGTDTTGTTTTDDSDGDEGGEEAPAAGETPAEPDFTG